MDNDIKAWLYDILNAIMEAVGYVVDAPKRQILSSAPREHPKSGQRSWFLYQ